MDTVIGCIIQHDQRGLMEIGNELVPEPSNIVVTIENFVVVSKMVPLLLWTKGPDRSRTRPARSSGASPPHGLGPWIATQKQYLLPLCFSF
jgi:hypothetical protein